jgi:hypothetical protein
MPEQGYRWYVNQHLLMEGLSAAKIQKFEFITNSFRDTMASMLPDDIVTPMGYFIFRK